MPAIAAAPLPYEFLAHGLALIVIDMQRDFPERIGNAVRPGSAGQRGLEVARPS